MLIENIEENKVENLFHEWLALMKRWEEREIAYKMESALNRWNAFTPEERLEKVNALRGIAAKFNAKQRRRDGYWKAKRAGLIFR